MTQSPANESKFRGEAKQKRSRAKRVRDAIAALNEDGIDESRVKKITFDQVAAEWLEEYMLTGRKRTLSESDEKR